VKFKEDFETPSQS